MSIQSFDYLSEVIKEEITADESAIKGIAFRPKKNLLMTLRYAL